MTDAQDTIVIGGGLAGIAAALALVQTGRRVTLLEARPKLGGATHSFERGGLSVDNGQHVFLKCCTAYQGLLARLDVADQVVVADRFDVPVLDPEGGRARIRRARLPGPLHFGPTLATYGFLSPAERAGAIRASLAMRMLDPADPRLDRQSLGDWLQRHGQGEHARRALWDMFVVSALNLSADDAALGLATKVCKTALMGAADAADIGMPAIPLGELHGAAAQRMLTRLGADVRIKSKVLRVEAAPHGEAHRFDVRLENETLTAGDVVVAVPHEAAAALLPPDTVPGSARWSGLGASPIVNVHVIYDRRVTDLAVSAAVDSPVQWVFDRTRISGLAESGDGQYLAVSVSAADDYIDRRTAELEEIFVTALGRLFPAARQAKIVDCFVTRERKATFRQRPGCGALRPGQQTPIPGLYLAGAWTDTGWPDTMEGAVRSGLQAARFANRSAPPAAKPALASRMGVPR